MIRNPLEFETTTNSFNVIVEPENRSSFCQIAQLLQIYESIFYRSGHSSVRILKEKFQSFYVGLMMNPSPFNDLIDNMIRNLLSGGIIGHWSRNFLYSTKSFEEAGPQVLSMDHLEIGFIICFFPLGLSLIVFFAEGYLNILSACWRQKKFIFKKKSKITKKSNRCKKSRQQQKRRPKKKLAAKLAKDV